MKNSKIVASYMGLVEMVQKKEKFPVKFSFALTKNIKTMEGLNKDFETERNKLLDMYNVKDENGEPAYKTTGMIEITPEHENDWKKDMQELLDIDVDANVHTVSVNDLDGVSMTAEDMLTCEFMITE